ncbi:Macro domain protein [uncultured virus]|nr:Macro domain protein [uncultured virus]
MELIFVDTNSDVINTYEKILGPGTNKHSHIFKSQDINTIATPDYPIDYIVSPANSHGLMDGGIDLIYSRMFPGIGSKVRSAIKKRYPETKLLPVGECLSVTIDEMRRCNPPCITKLIVCPTMILPGDIRDTDNVYLACRSLFLFLKLQKRKLRVIIPGMGTLTGRLTPEESAKQILLALTEIL